MMRFLLGLMFLSVISGLACASRVNQVVIVNHYDKPLTFIVGRHGEVLPEFPANFSLPINAEIQSRVLDIDTEAYIRAEDDSDHSAFFGINIEQEKVIVHGYISKGIAYSWNNQIITFCTPLEYKKKKSC